MITQQTKCIQCCWLVVVVVVVVLSCVYTNIHLNEMLEITVNMLRETKVGHIVTGQNVTGQKVTDKMSQKQIVAGQNVQPLVACMRMIVVSGSRNAVWSRE